MSRKKRRENETVKVELIFGDSKENYLKFLKYIVNLLPENIDIEQIVDHHAS